MNLEKELGILLESHHCTDLEGLTNEIVKLFRPKKHIEEIVPRCGNCIFWTLLTIPNNKLQGSCGAGVKFPDSRYARGEGYVKNMREGDGRNCPCFEPKLIE